MSPRTLACEFNPTELAKLSSYLPSAYSLAYHLFTPLNLDFLRLHAHRFIDQLWRVMTDGQHKNSECVHL